MGGCGARAASRHAARLAQDGCGARVTKGWREEWPPIAANGRGKGGRGGGGGGVCEGWVKLPHSLQIYQDRDLGARHRQGFQATRHTITEGQYSKKDSSAA